MYAIFEKEFAITDNMCSANQCIKPSGILDILQSVAGEHANILKIGFNDIISKNLAFVIARVKYDLLKPIKRYSRIKVVTWPCAVGRIEMKRDYEFYDIYTNELLLKASSIWFLIDYTNRKICRSSSVDYPTNIYQKENYDTFDKLKFEDVGFNVSNEYLVRHSDLDLNNHMNNTKYTDSVIYNGLCTFCQVDYIREVKLNDKLIVKTKQEEDMLYAIGTNDGEVSFKAVFKIEGVN